MVKAAQDDEISSPQDAEVAVARAVKQALQAAKNLCLAADLSADGDPVDLYINTAIRLRDLAQSLSPDKPEWPANVIPFVPRPTWE